MKEKVGDGMKGEGVWGRGVGRPLGKLFSEHVCASVCI